MFVWGWNQSECCGVCLGLSSISCPTNELLRPRVISVLPCFSEFFPSENLKLTFSFPAAPSVLKIITEYVAEKLNVQKSTQNRKKKEYFCSFSTLIGLRLRKWTGDEEATQKLFWCCKINYLLHGSCDMLSALWCTQWIKCNVIISEVYIICSVMVSDWKKSSSCTGSFLYKLHRGRARPSGGWRCAAMLLLMSALHI